MLAAAAADVVVVVVVVSSVAAVVAAKVGTAVFCCCCRAVATANGSTKREGAGAAPTGTRTGTCFEMVTSMERGLLVLGRIKRAWGGVDGDCCC